MNFLYPGFLFALLTVAIPVVIHLFNFRKFKKIHFSNVQFLTEIKEQNSSKEKLKNLLILLSRILAVVFLVLAFAQPYVPLNNQKKVVLNNVVSIYVDNSYSMEAINQDGTLLDEAKRRAKGLVADFGINDRFQLLTNDFEAKYQRLLSAADFLKALEDVKISGSSKNLQQILNRQSGVLSGQANKYSFILSDFQQHMASPQALQYEPALQYTFLKLKASPLPNVAVDSVWMLSPSHQPGASEQLVVQLKNYSETPATNVPLTLSINEQQKALASVNVGAGKTSRDTLRFAGLKAGWQKGLVRIKDFPLTFDDQLYFSFKVADHFSVLSINGNQTGNYIKALFAADPYYRLTENGEQNVNYNNFTDYGLIILNGLKNPSSGLAQQIKNYLKAGGTVVVFPDVAADIKNYNAFLRNLSLPVIRQVETTPVQVSKIELQHPVFKTVFEQVPKNIDLPTVNRYFSFEEGNRSAKERILELPGGKTFFARYAGGGGQIYLAASGLNPVDGNLATHPVFVPLMYRMALVGNEEEAIYYTIGSNNTLQHKKINPGKNQILQLKAGAVEVIPEIRQTEGKTNLYLADQIRTTGFYDLVLADSLLQTYAFNNNRAESDLHYLSKEQLEKLVPKSNLKVFDADKEAVKLISGSHKIGQTLWKLCLILSLMFIAAEILLIRFFNNDKKTI